MKKFVLNPVSGAFDLVFNVPELSTDPTSPVAGDLWVKKTGGVSGGGEIKAFLGLGFPALSPGAGGTATYELCYKTVNDGTVKVSLS